MYINRSYVKSIIIQKYTKKFFSNFYFLHGIRALLVFYDIILQSHIRIFGSSFWRPITKGVERHCLPQEEAQPLIGPLPENHRHPVKRVAPCAITSHTLFFMRRHVDLFSGNFFPAVSFLASFLVVTPLPGLGS